MSSPRMYRVSLRVSHPALPADQVASIIDLKVRYSKSVGESRVTKGGRELGGVYARTDVCFSISDGVISNDDILVADSIARALETLPLSAISQMVKTGGSCFFLLGIYSEDSLLCDFNAEMLLQLASNGIGLKLDFYGGPEQVAEEGRANELPC